MGERGEQEVGLCCCHSHYHHSHCSCCHPTPALSLLWWWWCCHSVPLFVLVLPFVCLSHCSFGQPPFVLTSPHLCSPLLVHACCCWLVLMLIAACSCLSPFVYWSPFLFGFYSCLLVLHLSSFGLHSHLAWLCLFVLVWAHSHPSGLICVYFGLVWLLFAPVHAFLACLR